MNWEAGVGTWISDDPSLCSDFFLNLQVKNRNTQFWTSVSCRSFVVLPAWRSKSGSNPCNNPKKSHWRYQQKWKCFSSTSSHRNHLHSLLVAPHRLLMASGWSPAVAMDLGDHSNTQLLEIGVPVPSSILVSPDIRCRMLRGTWYVEVRDERQRLGGSDSTKVNVPHRLLLIVRLEPRSVQEDISSLFHQEFLN